MQKLNYFRVGRVGSKQTQEIPFLRSLESYAYFNLVKKLFCSNFKKWYFIATYLSSLLKNTTSAL
jgi:hypothetical protein